MLCGTDPFPELFRAKRYKIHQKFVSKIEFKFIMRNLPVAVTEDDIEDMFAVADTDKDGRISYKVSYKIKDGLNISLVKAWIRNLTKLWLKFQLR